MKNAMSRSAEVKIAGKGYSSLLKDVKERIRSAQYQALKAVNKELIQLYWDIGKMIVERQKGDKWGKSIVEMLAKDLQAEFSGIQGFSPAGLWRMRNFYIAYNKKEKLAPLVREIGWSHNLIIFEKCKDDLEREFYIRMTRRMGWSKNVLIHQIENESYEKTLSSQTNFDNVLPVPIRNQAKLAVKDEYIFDFLELGEEHCEAELERAIISRTNRFLVEMGGTFAFMGNQYRLEIENQEYFIDILLYHRYLKCLVAIELKVGEFKPEYVGKMQFYLAALDDTVKLKGENPAIGIILCKEKKRTIVEYALKETKKPIGVAQYKITSKLPKELKKQLPTQKQIEKLLENV
ncbi:MAG: PDDEXK nuclease domain-containing protein [Planctomycetaceae bacterium]|nr:PDDEXK nuclease domain-containing protein [Planctomycetaceae bacterium]